MRRRPVAGPANEKVLPYSTSAWLRARRHRGPEQPKYLDLVYTRINEHDSLLRTLRPICQRNKWLARFPARHLDQVFPF